MHPILPVGENLKSAGIHMMASLGLAGTPMKPSLQDGLRSVPWLSRLDGLKRTIWNTRPDIRELCQWDQVRFDWWLVLFGAREYKAIAELELNVPAEFAQAPMDGAFPEVQPPPTRLMAQIWLLHPPLRASFDLLTPEGQQGLVWWFFLQGPRSFGLDRFVTDEQRRFLNGPSFDTSGGTPLKVTRLMAQVHAVRPDIRALFRLDEATGRALFIVWYYAKGVDQMGLACYIDDDQMGALSFPPQAPLVLEMIRAVDPAIRERFPHAGDPAFHDWAWNDGGTLYPILGQLRGLRCGGVPPAAPSMPTVARLSTRRPAGVNLIGYARGQLGIGEDVRMAAKALREARIPFAIRNVQPGPEVAQDDDSMAPFITDQQPFATNLLCVTGIETARLAAIHGRDLLDGRRTIGYWPWELPEWPEAWHHAYDLVDEVWASSRYTYEAFVRSCPKPVRHMPMAVTVDETAGLGRRDFGLPENRFLFVFAFDVLSSYARKNPVAAIRAFRAAFPLGTEPVGLVIKAMRASHEPLRWRALEEEVGDDPRITMITRTLGRAEVLDLYRSCDAFVSLHRSEGFGRGIAEAMMLGKVAIVTGHSGNMDFTLSATAALVDHRPRQVGRNEYPFGEGQLWVEPDIEHAAWWMRRLVADRSLRDGLSSQGQALTAAAYNPAAVGARYAIQLAAWAAETTA